MKLYSKQKPRLVIYVSSDEMKALKKAATTACLRTPHQIAGQWIRQRLLVP